MTLKLKREATMELNVNVKSVSGKKNRITTIPVIYSRDEMTVRELIEETVQFCESCYNKRKENSCGLCDPKARLAPPDLRRISML